MASLDWTDVDRLRKFLGLRFTYNEVVGDSFEEMRRQVAIPDREGEDTSDYLISRSLMRPRYLLRLINYCKSNAVNLSHDKFTVEDIDKAVANFSADSANEIGLELRDVFPAGEDILYYFIGARPKLTVADIYAILDQTALTRAEYNPIIETLMWFGFIGVAGPTDGDETYIYNVYYDMKKLLHLAGLAESAERFCIHLVFWPFLEIKG
jgi:hypothetical protein